MNIMRRAREFAQKKHKGQQYNGQEFMIHPAMTADILRSLTGDQNLIAAAYLHDTLEDTTTSYSELLEEFGSDIADLVVEVTKDGYNSFPNLKTQRGVMLKFADRLANLSQMNNWDEERKHKYMFEKSKFWK